MNEDQQIQPARSSVTLKRGAKGTYSWDVKLFRDDARHPTWQDFLDELESLDTALRSTYRSDEA